MPFKRARQPEQKAQRKLAILDATASLMERGGFDEVSLGAIAREVGLAKSNVYRYFESREQIFLELLIRDESAWVESLELALASLAGSDDADAVGAAVARTIAGHPRLCRLTAVLTTVLERNISKETVIAFKRKAMALSIRIHNAVGTALPSLSRESGFAFQRYVHAVIAGLWPISNPAPVVAEVLDLDEMESFRSDFETDLRGAVTASLRGLLVVDATS
jgi:AcrR family transcriptional regulator